MRSLLILLVTLLAMMSPDCATAATAPLVWSARNAEWHHTRAEALAKSSSPSTQPSDLVHLDDELSPDSLGWLDRVLPDRHRGSPSPEHSLYRDAPTVEVVEQSAKRARIKVTKGGAGWIVLAAPYADGWTATLHPAPTRFTPRPASREKLVLRAEGQWQALWFAESEPAEITFEYRPASYRRGMLAGALAGTILLLLAGFWLARIGVDPPALADTMKPCPPNNSG